MAEQVVAYKDLSGKLHATRESAESVDEVLRAEPAFLRLLGDSESAFAANALQAASVRYCNVAQLLADRELILKVFKAAAGG